MARSTSAAIPARLPRLPGTTAARRPSALTAAATSDHDVGADLGEGLRDRGADAAAGRGHDGDPVGELETVEDHGTFSFRAGTDPG